MTVEIDGFGYNANQFDRHPFEFDWLYPDKAGVDRLQSRLRGCLNAQTAESGMLCALLDMPEVTRAFKVKEFLSALDHYQGRKNDDCDWLGCRRCLLRYLNNDQYSRPDLPFRLAMRPTVQSSISAEVIDHFEKRLKDVDSLVADDLLIADKIWSPQFTELLLRYCERNPQFAKRTIFLFYVRGKGNPADPAVAKRLSAVWLKTATLLDKKPETLAHEDREVWSREMETLGQTRDVKLLPRLRRLLDDKTIVWDEADVPMSAMCPIPLTRACDVAMAAILTSAGWSEHDVAAEFSGGAAFGYGGGKAGLRAAKEKRDKVIAALKKRLESVDPASDSRPR